MIINWHKLSTWHKLQTTLIQNKLTQDRFTIDSAFPYVHHSMAISEITQFLSKQFPHRKKVYSVSGLGPNFDESIKQLSRDGLETLIVSFSELAKGLSRARCDELFKVDKETLFLLLPLDEPITGRRFMYPKEWLDELNKNRIFVIHVSHIPDLDDFIIPNPYQVKIITLPLSPSGIAPVPLVSLLCLGSRVRMYPSHSARQALGLIFSRSWQDQDYGKSERTEHDGQGAHSEQVKVALDEMTYRARFQSEVQDFESHLPQGFVPLFAPDDLGRVFDRTVFYHSQINGEALLSKLIELEAISNQTQYLKHSTMPRESKLKMFTTSISFHSRYDDFSWMTEVGLSQEVIRGLVVIDGSMANQQTRQALESVAQAILKVQAGEG